MREFVVQGVQDTQVIQPAVTDFCNHCFVREFKQHSAVNL